MTTETKRDVKLHRAMLRVTATEDTSDGNFIRVLVIGSLMGQQSVRFPAEKFPRELRKTGMRFFARANLNAETDEEQQVEEPFEIPPQLPDPSDGLA